jgi:hypothetical protein
MQHSRPGGIKTRRVQDRPTGADMSRFHRYPSGRVRFVGMERGRAPSVNGNRKLISCRQGGFIDVRNTS